MLRKGIVERDGTIRIIADLMLWAQWFEGTPFTPIAEGGRVVAVTDLPDGARVSTVFLGVEHHNGMWFETMLFGRDRELQQRYATYAEAVRGHAQVVAEVGGVTTEGKS